MINSVRYSNENEYYRHAAKYDRYQPHMFTLEAAVHWAKVQDQYEREDLAWFGM